MVEMNTVPGEEIDTSDIPEMDERFFAAAQLVMPPGTSREAMLRAYRLARRDG